MHLDIIRAFYNMTGDTLRDIAASDCIDGQPHRQQAVRVFAEYFPVHKIAPAPDDLAQHQCRHTDIRDLQETLLLHFAVHPQRDKSRDHRPVNGQSAFARIKDAEQIVPVNVPREDHVVDPRPDNGKNNGINGKIPDQVRIQLLFLRNMRRQQNAAENPQPDDHAVKSDLKTENLEPPRYVS